MTQFLSPTWFVALNSAYEKVPVTFDPGFAITYRITHTPFGRVDYTHSGDTQGMHLQEGAVSDPNAKIEMDYPTAVAIAREPSRLQECFMNGTIKFAGDIRMLIDLQATFNDAAHTEELDVLRAATIYDTAPSI